MFKRNYERGVGSEYVSNAEVGREEEEKANAQRQQRKIISAFALSNGGEADLSPFEHRDVEVSQDVRNDVIDGIGSGQYGEQLERQILDAIDGPAQRDGNTMGIFSRLSSKHELRILGMMTTGQRGFENYNQQSSYDVDEFLDIFPNPMDFEEESTRFLDMIERGNGKNKRAEYERAMESFKHKVYGKKQEYWEQMQALRAEAEARKKQHAKIGEHLAQMDSSIYERREWQKGDAGMWQVSRHQTREGFDSRVWADETCEDSALWRTDKKMFGVFDGAGGHGGGREASRLALKTANDLADKYILNSGSSLAYVLNAAGDAVREDKSSGFSTGVLAKEVDRNGRRMLAWASVGDSRLYVIHKDGSVEQITKDEGEGRVITNALGNPVEPGESLTQQWGDIDIHDGDRFLLCSDGITGDKDEELMSNEEISRIVMRASSAREASKRLAAAARKKDDRTAIVFEF